MRRSIAFVMGLAAIIAGSSCRHTPSSPRATFINSSSRQTKVPREYLITLNPGADIKIIAGLYGRFGIKEVKGIGNNLFLMTLIEDPGAATIEELRKKNAQIKATQPNFIYQLNTPAGPQ